jgi:Fe-S cluster biogenesis protein NfuA
LRIAHAGAGEPPQLRAIGEQIERLLDELRLAVIPREYAHVEEVVRLVTELYGAGLDRVLSIVNDLAPSAVADLAADELVRSLLILHGLHPDDLATRVEGALESVRPFLRHHDGDVALLDVDEAIGAVHLRLLGSCDGCPSSSVTLQLAVERAIYEAAPEITIIDVEALGTEVVPAASVASPDGRAVPVALRRKAVYDQCPSEVLSVAVS